MTMWSSDWEEIFANGPFSVFFNDFEIFYGPFLIILHILWWAISQVNGTMTHGPLPSQSLCDLNDDLYTKNNQFLTFLPLGAFMFYKHTCF